jgi:quercetin dioxygenase-like cupin family protein
MSHPDPNSPPDLRPIQIGEVWENPVTGERATILELPWKNPDHRFVAELLALVGARVLGEHRHPTVVERFTVLDGELTVKRDGQTSILREGETAVVEPGGWHDWWNATDRDVRVRVEGTPGERWLHGLETLWGLARLGHTNAKGMPNPLQLAVFAPEFSDVGGFRFPPPATRARELRVGRAIAPPPGNRGERTEDCPLGRSCISASAHSARQRDHRREASRVARLTS